MPTAVFEDRTLALVIRGTNKSHVINGVRCNSKCLIGFETCSSFFLLTRNKKSSTVPYNILSCRYGTTGHGKQSFTKKWFNDS